MNTLCVVGSINADLFVHVDRHPTPGETLLGSGGEVLPGGKGANQAVAAALQGANVAFVGAVGDDAYASPALSLLHQAGVDDTHISTVPDVSTGLAVITVSADGENTIVVVPGANATVTKSYVSSIDLPGDMLLLQGEIPADGFAAAVQGFDGRVVVNLAPVVDVPHEQLLRADPLVVNEHEAGLVLEQFGVSAGTASESVQALLDVGFTSVVLTLGAKGALVGTVNGLREIPTPIIEAVDTTGAGDAFTGALAARLLAGDDLEEAATHAARVGAYAACRRGAQPSYPSVHDELP